MNSSKYSHDINELFDEMGRYLNDYDERVFDTLAKLEHVAKKQRDYELLGIVYYNFAGAHYDHNNHEQVFNYIQKALYELLRGQDKEYVARTYNLFAIEAQRFGCLRVAYHYYNLAESFLSTLNSPLMCAIIKSNIGDLLDDLGNTAAGIVSIKESLDLFYQCLTEDTQINLILCTVNLAMQNIHAKDLDEARKAYLKVEELVDEFKCVDSQELQGWLLLLRAYFSLFDNNYEEVERISEDIISMIVHQPSFFFIYLKDMCYYTQELIEKKQWDLADKLLQEMQEHLPSNTPAWLHGFFIQVRIAYYRAQSLDAEMFDSYAELSRLLSSQQKIENKVGYQSICLIRIVDELQSELNVIRRQNENLHDIVETDSLVGIPNRRALNRTIDEGFRRAVNQKSTFGVGIVDIDSFKLFNDVYGHLAGDECLKSVAKTLDEIALDNNLFVARYGGDEFVFIYEGLTDEDIATIEDAIYEKIYVGVTHGYYNDLADASTRSWDFFMKADEALFENKRNKTHG